MKVWIVILILIGLLASTGSLVHNVPSVTVLSPPISEKVVNNTIDYINRYLLQPGDVARLDKVENETMIVQRIIVNVSGQQFVSYVSLDGKYLFTQDPFDMNVTAQSTANASQPINGGIVSAPNDSAGWKTYRSDKYGFSMEYPGNTRCGNFTESGNGNFYFGLIGMEVYKYGGDLDSYVNKYVGSDNVVTIESEKEIHINAGKAIKITYSINGTGRYGENTLLKNGDSVYVIGYDAGGFVCDEPEILPQMLSTLRFLK